MNKKPRRSKALLLKVLLALKPYLDYRQFVCNAAGSAREKGDITYDECEVFKDFIDERIEGHMTVTDWLYAVHGIPYIGNSASADDVKLEYRHRWVNAMIEEMKGT